MTQTEPTHLDVELAELRGLALAELTALGEDLGIDLSPPDPRTLSDAALNTAKAVDEAMAEVVEMAHGLGRSVARRRARALVRQLAEELTQALELAVLGAG